MRNSASRLKPVVATAAFFLATLARAESGADELLEALGAAGPEETAQIEERLTRFWGQSGSAAMDILLKRGQDALELGDARAAVAHFGAVIDHAPEFAEGYARRALALYDLGLIGPALADLEVALHLRPQDFRSVRGLAVLLEETGQPALALEAYERLLEIAPGDDSAAGARDRLVRTLRGRDL